jgi:mono/diheme cytochrome c family protein
MRKTAVAIVSFVLGLLVIPVVAYIYIAYGKPPVATADAPFPLEAKIVKIPLDTRIGREAPSTAPIPINDQNLTAGAEVYQRECAFCHGTMGKQSPTGKTMFPRTPQLWVKHTNGVVGVSDDPVGETYWKVKNGIRLTGMPAYSSILSEDQMWQVSLLLSTADKPLPASVTALLHP